MYKGVMPVETLLQQTIKQEGSPGSYSVLYGIGSWYLYNGQRDEARAIFKRMLAGNQWTSFGYIAAEADIKRIDPARIRGPYDLVSPPHHLAYCCWSS